MSNGLTSSELGGHSGSWAYNTGDRAQKHHKSHKHSKSMNKAELEKVIPDSYNQDGACGCYFLGQKTLIISETTFFDLLNEYEGAQK